MQSLLDFRMTIVDKGVRKGLHLLSSPLLNPPKFKKSDSTSQQKKRTRRSAFAQKKKVKKESGVGRF